LTKCRAVGLPNLAFTSAYNI